MQITINNSVSEINLVHQKFEAFAKNILNDKSVVQKMCVVIDEVLTNIIRHGYSDQKMHQINITLSIENKQLTMSFSDDGRAFNPLFFDLPDTTSDANVRPEGGLGIHLMKSLVDDIVYQRNGQFNHLLLKKNVK
jgi:anti-sigma regulatory factor (Ser/Thr protein kinase)